MENNKFFGSGFFDWQNSKRKKLREVQKYDVERYWGDFPKGEVDETLPDWAIGPFEKHDQPVFEPNTKGWDRGHLSGGVHNGSIIRKDGLFYYIYRGEKPYKEIETDASSSPIEVVTDYICDIGIAVSKDGINFERIKGSLFRKNRQRKYSFEDVCCVEHEGKYYLFCNRWDFTDPLNTNKSGVVLSVSDDLINWTSPKLLFKNTQHIHRNPCVVQSPTNQAVKVDGEFIMYLNEHIIAKSKDLMHWTSEVSKHTWPGGEGCFALADYRNSDDIILFTGGHHSGHFYAIGEVLFSKKNISKPLDWLKRPVLKADDRPYENGYHYLETDKLVSSWQDTIFFTGMTLYEGTYYCYYGGSEYFTCLAKAKGK